jgi:hypothetical protein
VAGRKVCSVAFVYRVHLIRALLVASLGTEIGRGGDASDDTTERRCISTHVGSCGVLKPLHELLEIVQRSLVILSSSPDDISLALP